MLKIKTNFLVLAALATLGMCQLSFGMGSIERSLFEAIREENFEKVEKLVKEKTVNINFNLDGFTPLMAACTKKNNKTVKLLLENGAGDSIDEIHNTTGTTPLLMACGNNNTEIVQLLSNYLTTETCNIKNKQNRTPIISACINNNLEITKILLKHGANPNAKVENKFTALSLTKNNDIKKLLIEYGAIVDEKAIIMAEEGDHETLELLKKAKLLDEKKENKIQFILDQKENAGTMQSLAKRCFCLSLKSIHENQHKSISQTDFGQLYSKLSLEDLNKIFDVHVQSKENIDEFAKKAAQANYFYFDQKLVEKNVFSFELLKKQKKLQLTDVRFKLLSEQGDYEEKNDNFVVQAEPQEMKIELKEKDSLLPEAIKISEVKVAEKKQNKQTCPNIVNCTIL